MDFLFCRYPIRGIEAYPDFLISGAQNPEEMSVPVLNTPRAIAASHFQVLSSPVSFLKSVGTIVGQLGQLMKKIPFISAVYAIKEIEDTEETLQSFF